MLCAMSYLDPADHRLWKGELREGRADPLAAAEVGRRLGRIHAATANDPDLAEVFPRHDIFHAIRLEPYLEATAAAHPDLREVLFGLSRRTGETRIAMVHGDISPKNILLGPAGPVFLDAECACIGDPAFDIAFCLNHLLLKRLPRPDRARELRVAFLAFVEAYFGTISVEPRDPLEARTAQLLPALFLARVDGKSPVEYLTQESDKERVRDFATPRIADPGSSLQEIASDWFDQGKGDMR